MFGILEVVFRLWRNKSGPLTMKNITNTMTTEEYEKAVHEGRKLCILDDYVLDVTKYASRHPGGQFLIQATVGRDVSKYFYGGYKMENAKSNRDSPYRHSMSARKVVSTLIVARLNNPAPKSVVTIVDRTPIVQDTQSFTFKSVSDADKIWSLFYEDIWMIGRHFLVTNEKI